MRIGTRLLAALFAFALAWMGGAAIAPRFAVSAQAEEAEVPALDIAAAVSPEAVAGPGDVELTFTLTNRSAGTLYGVSLASADGLIAEVVGDIAAGESRTVSRTHTVAQAELDAGSIGYVVTCESENAGLHSYSVAIEISQDGAEPEVEFLRRISSAQVTVGNTATVAYRVENTGTAAVENVVVSDPGVGFEARIEGLEAGQSELFLHRTAISEDVVSEPVLSYSAAGQENVYTVRLEAVDIEAAQGRLNATLVAGVSMFDSEMVEAVLQLTNAGDVDYRDIVVYDDVYGGVIADGISLPAGGDPVEITHTYPLRGEGTYCWRITGTSAAGAQVDFITDVQTVAAGVGEPLLALEVSASLPHIRHSGYVTFTLEISNAGDGMASNVVLSEASLGELGELAVVPTGEPTRYTVRLEVGESTDYLFSATYTGTDGETRIATADAVSVIVGAGGEDPEPEEPDAALAEGTPMQMGNSSLFLVLLIGSCVVLVVLIIVLLVTSRKARKARKERAAVRKQRMKEEMGKTNRFVPVRHSRKRKQG